MIRLIIADDEEIERKAFRLFLNRNFPDIIVLEDAVNGIDFINKVTDLAPDIAIVDINMPGLNGLEAIKALKQKNIAPKIIIHTAYGQFQYAQEALTLGADDYILKPVKREKIVSTISNCILKINEERKKENEQIRLVKIVNEISPIIETDFMSSILLGDINNESLQVYLDILGIKFISGYIMTVSLPNEDVNTMHMDVIEKNAFKKEILGFIKLEMKNICSSISSSVISNRIVLFISIDEELTQYRFKVWSIEVAELIMEKLKKQYNITANIGIGQLYNNLDQLNKSYKESLNSILDKSFVSNVKHFGDIFHNVEYINPFQNFERDIIMQINTCNMDACKETLDKIFKELDQIVEFEAIKDMALGCLIAISKGLQETNFLMELESYSIKNIFTQIIDMNNKIELKSWMTKTMEAIIEEIKLLRKDKINNFVKCGIHIINERFSQDLSLERVSEEIGVSPYYLSRLFKQELNQNFIDYLTEIRVKQALKLIKENNYSIKELSEKVGYSNPTYFCKVFKRVTGKTIGEFKESSS